MISFETYNEIHSLLEDGMSCARIARRLHLSPKTVRKWAALDQYMPRKATPRASKLDPFKSAIRSAWELGGCTVTEIMNHLRADGYTGGYTILKTYLRGLRRRCHAEDTQLLLPSQWMLRLLQCKIPPEVILADCEGVTRDAAAELLARIHGGPLRLRNSALAVLANAKHIPIRAIARFLVLDHKTVLRYAREYSQNGVEGLTTYRRSGPPKHEQKHYKDAVFALLHSPPKEHGVSRTA